ncbi:MAG: rod shape-determining protein MreC [Candidatus Pelagibacter sp.]
MCLLKKGTKQRFSLVVLIFFSLTILFLGKYDFKGINILKSGLNEFVYRSTFIISIPENFVKNTYNLTLSHINLYNDHKKLKKDFNTLQAESLNNDFIISENRILRSKIEDIVDVSSEILAKVLVDKQSPFLKSVIVNRGSKDKVKLGMAVLDGEFLIGKVVEVNYRTSRVLLLSDLNSKVPVSIEPNSIQSILTGTGQNVGKLQYTQLDNLDLKKGDQIYSSGSGGIFKSGIPIGKINFIDDNNESYVLFHSNFSQLRLVKIVLYENLD